jgi:hypothetical protein
VEYCRLRNENSGFEHFRVRSETVYDFMSLALNVEDSFSNMFGKDDIHIKRGDLDFVC